MKAILERVDDILAASSRPSDVLDSLRNAASLAHFLEVIRADRARLMATANASYRHRNGFDKIVLASPAGCALKLVLHLWQQGEASDGIDHIHNHRWDFASIVLQGALRYELYDKDPRGAAYSKMQYRPLPQSRSYELAHCGSMTVSVQATATLAAGSTYTWAATLLHRAWAAPGQATATLIVQGPPVRRRTTVLVDSSGGSACLEARNSRLGRLEIDDLDRTLARLATDELEAAWYSDLNSKLPSASCLTP